MSGRMERVSRGWAMAKASLAILRRHPKLLVLPAASGALLLSAVGLMALMTLPKAAPWHAAFMHLIARLGVDIGTSVAAAAAAFAVIYLLTAASIFFNAALIFCAMRCHAGETPSVRAGLSAAAGNLGAILGWAFLATTVGLLITAIETALEESGVVGKLVASIIGGLLTFAWSVTTYFVLPILVVERLGPIAAVRRSASVLRQKWGEAVGGEARFGLFGLLFLLPAALLFFGGLVIVLAKGATAHAGAGPVLMGIGIAITLVTLVVLQALNAIFQSGVYLYATTGQVPSSLGEDAVASAFRPKG